MAKQDDGLLLSGSLWLRNRRVAGSGFVQVGNVTDLKFETSSETKKRESRQKNQLGQILDSVVINQGTSVSWTFDTFNRDNMAIALSGEVVEIKTATATETDVSYTVTKKGEAIALSHDDINPTTLVVKNKDDQEVADGFIELSPVLGLLTIAADCPNVKDGEVVKVSYSKRARTGYEVKANTVADFDFELKLDGYNHASNKDCSVHCDSVKVAADGAIDWLKGDFASTSVKGDVVTVNGNKYAYTYREFDDVNA